ncbi:MAG: hypothetical protein KDD73_03185 [Anaerolineales bacterium]|nr:hypothetical protein [Anaerolineales bacterium]MCB9127315.1 hypothetical protein [Ardenticatenales bacterium]
MKPRTTLLIVLCLALLSVAALPAAFAAPPLQESEPTAVPNEETSEEEVVGVRLDDFNANSSSLYLVDPFDPASRGSVKARMTRGARRTAPNSPLHNVTWVSYYGRPNVDIMGILGEFDLDELADRLQTQADAYDDANGPEVGVQPAFELVHGMALCCQNEDNSFLGFLDDEIVEAYINAAQERGFAVVLDVQIGNLTPQEAMARAFKWLKYDNVHLAFDPEFAMREPGQEKPGQPPGYVTAQEVNEVQQAMRDYMVENDIPGRRVLILHQFLLSMIKNKEELEQIYKVDMVITADGWGTAWQKLGKYNSFIYDDVEYAGYKLFYRWDDPVMTEAEALGAALHPGHVYMDFTPNVIIYQ